jgi:hypothetical protein
MNGLICIKSLREFVYFFYSQGNVTAFHKLDKYFDEDLAPWIPESEHHRKAFFYYDQIAVCGQGEHLFMAVVKNN